MTVARNREARLVAAAVALAALVVFLPALANGFVNWDDPLYVTGNARVRALGPGFLAWAFTTVEAANWHPLTWLSHGLDVLLFGERAWGHHLTSVLLHAANAYLFVRLAQGLLRAAVPDEDPALGRTGLAASAAAGLLWAVHPLRVESVAWISERKDVLCAFFFLLALRSWVRGARLVPLVAFALALLAKPMAVTLPAVMVVLAWYPLRRLGSRAAAGRLALGLVPYAVLAGAAVAVTLLAQGRGAVVSPEGLGPLTRAATAALAVSTYLAKTVAPIGLLPFYPHPKVVTPLAVASLVAVLAVTVTALRTRRALPWVLAAWAWFLLTLAPVLGFVQVGGQFAADRYTYLPGLAPSLLGGWGLARLDAWLARGDPGRRGRARALAALGALVLAGSTVVQVGTWRSSVDLWTAAIEGAPGTSSLPYYNRAKALEGRGDVEGALRDYAAAIEVQPLYRDAWFNRAVLRARTDDLPGALADFDRALRLGPGDPEALLGKGAVLGRLGRLEEAVAAFGEASAAAPADPRPVANRARALERLGRGAEARADLARACALGLAEACAGRE